MCAGVPYTTTQSLPKGLMSNPTDFISSVLSKIAEYDAGSKIIVTKKPGNATLTVTDARKSVKAEVSFMVKKKGFFH
jgi:hypothetical protein